MPRIVKVLSANIADMTETLRILRDEVEDLRGALMAKPISSRRIPIGFDRACEIVGKSKNTLYRYTSQGRIPHYKKGGSVYFFEDELLEWVRAGRFEQTENLSETADMPIIQLPSKSRRSH